MDYKAAAALLGGWDNILILTHKRPDGDTLGCAVGLCALLRQCGKTAWVLNNPDATSRFTPYLEGYIAPEGFVYDKVVAVDVAALGLFGAEARAIADSRGVDLCIDHHPSNEHYAKETCVEADKAACGEIIYKIVSELGHLDDQIAAMLYLAISTDTGCFVYNNTTPHTHAVAAVLMERDIHYKAINKRHFRTKSMVRLQIESRLLEHMEVLEEGKVVLSAITLADLAELHAREEDVEDIAAFLGQIEGVKVSATIRELEGGECKISLRTDPDYLNATQTCALLGGGGHEAASACAVTGTVRQAQEAMKQAILQVLHGA